MSDVAWMFRTAEIPKHAFYMGDPDEKTSKENRKTLALQLRIYAFSESMRYHGSDGVMDGGLIDREHT
jgi:hypothetical protein